MKQVEISDKNTKYRKRKVLINPKLIGSPPTFSDTELKELISMWVAPFSQNRRKIQGQTFYSRYHS